MMNMKTVPTFPIGALEVILEAQQILEGKRQHLSALADYKEQRRRYWHMQAQRPPWRPRAAEKRRAA